MSIFKHRYTKRIVALLIVALTVFAIIPIRSTEAASAVDIESDQTNTEYFEYNGYDGWESLSAPHHWIVGSNEIAYCLQHKKDSPHAGDGYYKQKHPNSKKFNRMSQNVKWSAMAIHKILNKYSYTGAMVSHVREKASLTSSKRIACEKPIIVEGMHEGIVSKEEYELAQAVITRKKDFKKVHQKRPLSSLIKCAECGHSLAWSYRKTVSNRFFCNYARSTNGAGCSSGVLVWEDEIQSAVYNAIKKMIELAGEVEVTSDVRKKVTNSQNNSHVTTQRLKATKLRLYERYTEGKISKEVYLHEKQIADEELKKECERDADEGTPVATDKERAHKNYLSMCKSFEDCGELTYEMAHAFVSAVYVHTHGSIEIKWKFKNIFEGK